MELSINRLGQLIKRNLILSGKRIVAVPTVLVMVAILFASFGLFQGQISLHSYVVNSCMFLFVGGLILTSLSFAELNKPDTGLQYLSLPASGIEKFLSGWFLSFVVYILSAVLAFYLGYGVLQLIDLTEANLVGEMVTFKDFRSPIEGYFFFNALFLLGAATFKKGMFMKTVAASIGAILLLLFFYWLFAYFIFIQGMDFSQYGNVNFGMSDFNKEHTLIIENNYLGHIILIGTSIFFLVVGYFKITEREI